MCHPQCVVFIRCISPPAYEMQRYKNKKRNASFLPIFFVLCSTFRPFSESKSRGPHLMVLRPPYISPPLWGTMDIRGEDHSGVGSTDHSYSYLFALRESPPVRKSPNKFVFLLTYSYLCHRETLVVDNCPAGGVVLLHHRG